MLSKKARQQAQAEGLTLRVADNKAGYFGVNLTYPDHPRPYEARWQDGEPRQLRHR